jgi:hypothetical protein
MQAIEEVNELLTAKLCSPVIVYCVVLVISLVSIYFCRQKLSRYNTEKMDNLYHLSTMQELKFLIVLGVIMYGLCQYNKTELAWIFLIFPVIYVLIQNALLYIHVSSAIQNAPAASIPMNTQNYGLSGMNMPLLQSQQMNQPVNQQMNQQIPVAPLMKKEPQKMQDDFMLPKISGQSQSLGGGEMPGFNL